MEQFLSQNIWILLAAALWSLPWKAIALWKAARREERLWFAVLLVVNTLALLEIFYLFVFSRKAKVDTSFNSKS